jgi:hypothetical protein
MARVRLLGILWGFIVLTLFFWVINNGYTPSPDLWKGITFPEFILLALFMAGFLANMFFVFFGRIK